MKNRLTDLNDYLFMQLERLADETLSPDQIKAEIARADAIVGVSDTIVANAKLQLDAAKLIVEHGDKIHGRLPMIAGPDGTNGARGESKS